MRIRSGDAVDSVEFVMADGTVENGGYYAFGGNQQPTFELEADEYIVRIEARQKDRLNGLKIYTSHGRASEMYGRAEGDMEAYKGTAENPIVGIQRDGPFDCPRIVSVRRLSDPLPAQAEASAVSPLKQLQQPSVTAAPPCRSVRLLRRPLRRRRSSRGSRCRK